MHLILYFCIILMAILYNSEYIQTPSKKRRKQKIKATIKFKKRGLLIFFCYSCCVNQYLKHDCSNRLLLGIPFLGKRGGRIKSFIKNINIVQHKKVISLYMCAKYCRRRPLYLIIKKILIFTLVGD